MAHLLGIGRLAQASGLTVSALRFYDSAGLLTPAEVDPHTGYRRYAADQLVVVQLLARLRRVQMPLAEVARVLAHRHDPDGAGALLDAHLRSLERGLADARLELASIRSLMNNQETPMTSTTLTLSGGDFVSALDAVRFAVSADPEHPALTGLLLDITDGSMMLVATDRYRLAVASVPCLIDGPDQSVVVSVAFADGIAATATPDMRLTVDPGAVTSHAGGVTTTGDAIAAQFPDYRRLLSEERTNGATVGPDLRAALIAGPTHTRQRDQDEAHYDATIISTDEDGQVIVVSDDREGVGVNREFLLQALDAGGDGQLHLFLDGPITPLIIRSPRSVSLLMPVRL